MQYLKSYKKKSSSSPPIFFFFFFLKKNRQKKNKNMLYENKQKHQLACAMKSNLFTSKVQNLPRQKISSLMCFFCHPQIVPAELSQDNKRKYEG